MMIQNEVRLDHATTPRQICSTQMENLSHEFEYLFGCNLLSRLSFCLDAQVYAFRKDYLLQISLL